MQFTRKEIVAWAKHFKELCEKNDIWYAIDAETLLGAKRHGGFVPWEERFQVMMTPESYTKLKRLFPENVIDSTMDKDFESLKPAFVENYKTWEAEKPFVEIRILVPTTLEKIKKFRSKTRFAKDLFTMRRNSTNNAINDLKAVKFEGFYLIENRLEAATKCWIPNVTFKMETLVWNGQDMPVIKEFEEVLKNQFGDNYMDKLEVPAVQRTYPSPTVVVKEEL